MAESGPGMSESEQMYLVATAMLIEDGMARPIPLPALAEARHVVPASVNQMVRKLADAGFIHYIPYRGVELTPVGASVATRIVRYRRLWEVFLHDRLGLPVKEADALACRLEHLTSDDVANRLSDYLGNPTTSPQGRPIPAAQPLYDPLAWLPLSEVAVTRSAQVAHVEADPVTRAFLAGQGIAGGATVMVQGVGSDGRILLQVDDRAVQLAPAAAASVKVLPLD